MIAAGKLYVLHFRAGLNSLGGTLYRQILDKDYGIAILKHVPLASFTTVKSGSSVTASMSSFGFHSWPHSGHIIDVPVGYPYNDWQLGHLLDSGMSEILHKSTQLIF